MSALNSYLEGFITERRKNLFHEVVNQRTRYITVVLEDIYQAQNASAVLRTCDCFGIQDVHIIENNNLYDVNPDVALGSDKWLNLYKYNELENNTEFAIKKLKKSGYRIIATTPHKDTVNVEDFNLSKGKTALMFGTELKGLSKEALDLADEYLKIPMFGFTESFNISVSAAIILHHLTLMLKSDKKIDWMLSDNEKSLILLQWLKNTIKDPDALIERFYKKNTEK